jgi:hypothetical protein
MTTHLQVVWEGYRLFFRGRSSDYDWLDDALWDALAYPTRVDTVMSWFGVGESILVDAIARLLLRGVLLIDPNAGTVHRTGSRPAPGTDRLRAVDVWQDQRTGIIVSLFDASGGLKEGFTDQPPEGATVVTFTASQDPMPLWPRILELSDAELYAALPVRIRPPQDRDVNITRERLGARTTYCPVWQAPGLGIAFPSVVPTDLRTLWRRCKFTGVADVVNSVPKRSWDDLRNQYQTWKQLVGAWEAQAADWLENHAFPAEAVTMRASAIARTWLDRTRISRGRFEPEALRERLRFATHSVALRWTVQSELLELVASIPPGLEVVVYAAQGEAVDVPENGSLHRFELDEEFRLHLPRRFVLIDTIDLWRVEDAVRNWPNESRGRGCLRISSDRALDKMTEVLRGLPGGVRLLPQRSFNETDIRSDRIVESAGRFVSQFEEARRLDAARRASAGPNQPAEPPEQWFQQQREALRRIADELRWLGMGAVNGAPPALVSRRPLLSVEYVPELDASELLEAAGNEVGRVRVIDAIAGSEGGAASAPPRSNGGQGGVDIWRIEEGAAIRYLLGERDGVFPWVVVSLDAGEAHAAFDAEFGLSSTPPRQP